MEIRILIASCFFFVGVFILFKVGKSIWKINYWHLGDLIQKLVHSYFAVCLGLFGNNILAPLVYNGYDRPKISFAICSAFGNTELAGAPTNGGGYLVYAVWALIVLRYLIAYKRFDNGKPKAV